MSDASAVSTSAVFHAAYTYTRTLTLATSTLAIATAQGLDLVHHEKPFGLYFHSPSPPCKTKTPAPKDAVEGRRWPASTAVAAKVRLNPPFHGCRPLC